MPQVDSGVRKGLRPISGRIAAGSSPPPRPSPSLGKYAGVRQRRQGDDQRRRREQAPGRPASARPDRFSRRQLSSGPIASNSPSRMAERPGHSIEIGRADRKLLAADRFGQQADRASR